MSFFEFDHDAYYRQIYGPYGDASAVDSDTETRHHTGSPAAHGEPLPAVLQGLRNLGIEHRHRPAGDAPQIGRPSFAGSMRMDGRLRRDDMFHSTRHSHVDLWRADAPAPRDIPEHQPVPEHIDAQVTRHTGAGQAEAGSSSAAAPRRRRGVLGRAGRASGHMLGASTSGQRTNPAPGRRRARDEADQEVQPRPRYIAGSIMQAEETTLPRPDLAQYPAPCDEDLELIERARAGLAAGGAKKTTKRFAVQALSEFSAWLRQVGRAPMRDRLFTQDLENDVQKFVRLGGNFNASAALDHLCDIESSTHGTTQIATRVVRRDKAVPDADRLLVDLAFGGDAPVSQAVPGKKINTEAAYRQALLSLSEWLWLMDHPGLADSEALHSDRMTDLADQYAIMELPHSGKLKTALAQLRQFDLTGAINIQRNRNTLSIPEADQRLIERYRAQANKALEAAAQSTGKKIRDTKGQTKYDTYASRIRSFSTWLQVNGIRNIASRLDSDFDSLMADVDLYDDGKKGSRTADTIRNTLDHMRTMFLGAPEVTMARIEPNRFVHALGMFMANVSVADVAQRTGADEGDLRVFLDERSATGLTEGGQAAVNLFDGRLRQAADANIALRVQSWGQPPQHMGQMPTHTPSPYHLSPMSPSAFPSFSGLDDPAAHPQYGTPASSSRHDADSGFPELSSLSSAAYFGGFEFDLNTPSEEAAQQSRADSVFEDQSSLTSAGGLQFDLNTPSEVDGPSQPQQPLPAGAVGNLNQVLRNLNVNVGYASGDGLNCLIDTVLQLQSNTRRPDHGRTAMPELEAAVQMWRNYLFQVGIVPEHGQIDLYATSAVGANLAHNMQVRIQAIEVVAHGQAIAHPVLGQHGPLLHILHTPGHFQPLWPRQG